MDEKSLGAKIQAARNAKGYTADELAEIINKSSKSISPLETGARGTTLSTLMDYCHALDAKPSELLAADLNDSLDNYPSDYIDLFEFVATLTPYEISVLEDIIEITIEKRKSYRETKS